MSTGNGVHHEITQAKRRAFLAAYGQMGNITLAAEAAHVHRRTHYVWLEQDHAYKQAFAEAHERAMDVLEAAAYRRAVEGLDEPVIYQGKLQGIYVDAEGRTVTAYTPGATLIPLTVKKYDTTLLIFLLNGGRPEKFRERRTVELSGRDGAAIPLTLVMAEGQDVP